MPFLSLEPEFPYKKYDDFGGKSFMIHDATVKSRAKPKEFEWNLFVHWPDTQVNVHHADATRCQIIKIYAS